MNRKHLILGLALVLFGAFSVSAARYKPGGRVLVVNNDDGSTVGAVRATNIINNMTGYTAWYQTAAATVPSTWTNYNVIVWITGSDGTPFTAGTVAYHDALYSHVTNGGRLIIEGGEIAYYIRGAWQDIWRRILHSSGWISDSNGSLFTNVGTHFINTNAGIASSLGFTGGVSDADSVQPAMGGVPVYAGTSGPVVNVYDDFPSTPRSGQVVFLGFNLVNLDNDLDEQKLIENSVHWLTYEAPPILVRNVTSGVPYSRIRDAVASATPGDVLELTNAVFSETVNIDRNVTIRSYGWRTARDNTTSVVLGADLDAFWVQPNVTSFTMQGFTVREGGDDAVYLEDTGGAFRNCVFQGNGRFGVYAVGTRRPVLVVSNSFYRNGTLNTNVYALALANITNYSVIGNSFVSNGMATTGSTRVVVGLAPTYGSSNCLIQGNTFAGNGPFTSGTGTTPTSFELRVYSTSPFNTRIQDNLFRRNKENGGVVGLNLDPGVLCRPSIVNNVFEGYSRGTNRAVQVTFTSCHPVFRNNLFSFNGYGVYDYSASSQSVYENNVFYNNGLSVVFNSGSASAIFRNNIIENNYWINGYGIYLASGTDPTVEYCVNYGNTSAYYGFAAIPSTGCVTNMSAQFFDPSSRDCSLKVGSPGSTNGRANPVKSTRGRHTVSLVPADNRPGIRTNYSIRLTADRTLPAGTVLGFEFPADMQVQSDTIVSTSLPSAGHLISFAGQTLRITLGTALTQGRTHQFTVNKIVNPPDLCDRRIFWSCRAPDGSAPRPDEWSSWFRIAPIPTVWNRTFGGLFATIQAAISNAPAGTSNNIVVFPGYYSEQIRVYPPHAQGLKYHIQAVDASTNPAVGKVFLDANNKGCGFDVDGTSIPGSVFRLDDFTIQNGTAGVRIRAASGSLKSNVILNSRYAGIDLRLSAQITAAGNQIRGGGAETNNAYGIRAVTNASVLIGNRVSFFDAATNVYGIYLRNATGDVTGNTVATNSYHAYTRTFGIYCDNGTTSRVVQNTIRGIQRRWSDEASGIGIISANPVVRSNSISAFDGYYRSYGIKLEGAASQPSIQGNRITGCGLSGTGITNVFGIYAVLQARPQDISWNTIESNGYNNVFTVSGIYCNITVTNQFAIRGNTVRCQSADDKVAGIYVFGPQDIVGNTINDLGPDAAGDPASTVYGIRSENRPFDSAVSNRIFDNRCGSSYNYGIYGNFTNTLYKTASLVVSNNDIRRLSIDFPPGVFPMSFETKIADPTFSIKARIIGNTIVSNQCGGDNYPIDLDYYMNAFVSYNLIACNDRGIRLYDANTRAMIYNNTFHGNLGNAINLSSGSKAYVTNNIFSANLQGINAVAGDALNGYNCFWMNGSDFVNGATPGASTLYLDPLYRNPVIADFHLLTTAEGDAVNSPCINVGRLSNPGGHPPNAAPDLGCFEATAPNFFPMQAKLLQPFDNAEVGQSAASTTPSLMWTIPSDPEGDRLHFVVQWASNSSFTRAVVTRASSNAPAGFVPSVPVASGGGTMIYTIRPVDALLNGAVIWWRVQSDDTNRNNGTSGWTTARSYKVNTSLTQTRWHQTSVDQFNTDILDRTETFLSGDGAVRINTGAPSGLTTIYTDSFEGGATAWTVTGDWQRGVPVLGPGTAWSGQRCFATLTNATYNSATLSYLTSPAIAVTGKKGLKLSWYMYQDVEDPNSRGNDGMNVRISTNGGTSWFSNLSPLPGYTHRIGSNYSSAMMNEWAYCGDVIPWAKRSIDLSAYQGSSTMRVRFAFAADSASGAAGCFIDAVAVEASNANPVYQVTSPTVRFDAPYEPRSAWGRLEWTENTATGNILMNLEYSNAGAWKKTSFTNLTNASGYDISSLAPASYPLLRLRAVLTNSGGSPYLLDWSLGWGPKVYSGPFYVKNGGSDLNDGSKASPFATIQRAANAMAKGLPACTAATTFIHPGTWNEQVSILSNRNPGWMVFTALSNSRRPLLRGNPPANIWGFRQFGAGRVLIDSIRIVNYTNGVWYQDRVTNSMVRSVDFVSNFMGYMVQGNALGNSVLNCLARDNNRGFFLASASARFNELSCNTAIGPVQLIGFCLADADRNTVRSNRASRNAWDGIYLTGSASTNRIACNNVYSNSSQYGILLDNDQNDRNTIESNWVWGINQPYGIAIYNGDGNDVRYNQTWQNGSYGIFLTSSASSNRIAHNLAWSNGSTGIKFDTAAGLNEAVTNRMWGMTQEIGLDILNTSGCLIASNTAFQHAWDGIYIEGNSRSNIVLRNVVFSNASQYGILINGEGSDNNLVASNEAWGLNQPHGIALYDGDNNVLRGNRTFRNAYSGIYLVSPSSTTNNLIVGNFSWSNGTVGIKIESDGSDRNSVISNTVWSSNHAYALWIADADQILMSGNILTTARSNGIYISGDSSDCVVSDNLIRRNAGSGIFAVNDVDRRRTRFFRNIVVTNGKYGVNLNRSIANQVISNTFGQNTLAGLRFDSFAPTNRVYGNTFLGPLQQTGVEVGGGDVATIISNNILFRNNGGGVLLNGVESCRVGGNTLWSNGPAGVVIGGTFARKNTVLGNVLYGHTSAGVSVFHARQNIVGPANRTFRNGQNGIQVTGIGASNLIIGNMAYSNGTAGIAFVTGTGFSNTAYSNTVWGTNQNFGLYIGQATNDSLIKNIVYANRVGVGLIRSSGSYVFRNRVFANLDDGLYCATNGGAMVLNNTFWSNKGDAMEVAGGGFPSSTIRNDIFGGSGGYGLRNAGGAFTNRTCEYWMNISGDVFGTPMGIGSFSSNPRFLTASPSFTLSSNSPCVNSGYGPPYAPFPTDFLGIAPDIGAVESSWGYWAGPFFVDDTSGSNTSPGTFARPFRTIQKAADVMSLGAPYCTVATTYVFPGTYKERVDILQNMNPGQMVFTSLSNKRALLSANMLTNAAFFISNAARIAVRNLDITKFAYGFRVRGTSPDLVFDNNNLTDFTQSAVLVQGEDADNLVFTRNRFSLSRMSYAVYLIGCDGVTLWSNDIRQNTSVGLILASLNSDCLISQNRIWSNSGGINILLEGSDRNTIVSNEVWTNRGYGLLLNGMNWSAVRDNVIRKNAMDGIRLAGGFWSNQILNNRIDSNLGYGINFASTNRYNLVQGNRFKRNSAGIYMGDGQKNIIRENIVDRQLSSWGVELNFKALSNVVIRNTVFSNTQGINCSSELRRNSLISNTIYWCQYGIELDASTRNVDVAGNDVSQNLYYGITIGEATNHIIRQNRIHDNTQSGISIAGACKAIMVVSNQIWRNGTLDNNAGIEISSSRSNRVEYNLIWSNKEVGIRLSSGSNFIKANDIWGQRNVTALPGGIGVNLASSSGNVIYYNRIHHNQENGVYYGAAAVGNYVNKNFVYRNSGAGMYMATSVVSFQMQNTLLGNTAYGISMAAAAEVGVTNCLTTGHPGAANGMTKTGGGGGTTVSYDTFQDGFTGVTAGVETYSTPPFSDIRFVSTNMGSEDFHLQWDSPQQTNSRPVGGIRAARGAWTVRVKPGNPLMGAVTSYTIRFITTPVAGAIPPNGVVEMTFPSGFNISGAALGASTFSGGLVLAINGQTIRITRDNLGAASIPNRVESIVINNIVNPVLGADNFRLTGFRTKRVDGYDIDGPEDSNEFRIAYPPHNGPFYVDDDSGNDMANGSQLYPFRTVQRAANRMMPGVNVTSATTFVLPGVYVEKVLINTNKNPGLMVVKALSNTVAPPTLTAGYAAFNGVLVTNARKVMFDGLRFSRATNSLVLCGSSSNNIVRNCVFESNVVYSLVVRGSMADNNLLFDNLFRGTNGIGAGGIVAGIGLADADLNVVRSNTFRRTGVAIRFDGNASSNHFACNLSCSNKAGGVLLNSDTLVLNRVMSNVFQGSNHGIGIRIAGGKKTRVARNLVHHSSSGMLIQGYSTNTFVANNTFAHISGHGVQMLNFATATLVNNIFLSNAMSAAYFAVDGVATGIVTCGNNVFFGGVGAVTNGPGIVWLSGNTFSDPMLRTDDYSYVISTNISTAIDSGQVIPLISDSFFSVAPDKGWKESQMVAVNSGPFFVDDSSGSDANTGTFRYPFRTVQKAALVMMAGPPTVTVATTYLFPGTYNERVKITNNPNPGYMVITRLSNTRPRPFLNGQKATNFAFKLTNASRVILSSLGISRYTNAAVILTGVSRSNIFTGITFVSNGANNIRFNTDGVDANSIISNTFLLSFTGNHIYGLDGDQNIVRSNRFSFGAYGVMLYWSARSNEISFNQFSRMNSSAVNLGDEGVDYTQILNNRMWSNSTAYQAITLNGSDNTLIRSNIIRGTMSGVNQTGIQISGFAVSNLVVCNQILSNYGYGVYIQNADNNSVLSNRFGWGAMTAAVYVDGCNRIVVRSNTFYKGGNYAVRILNASSQARVIQNKFLTNRNGVELNGFYQTGLVVASNYFSTGHKVGIYSALGKGTRVYRNLFYKVTNAMQIDASSNVLIANDTFYRGGVPVVSMANFSTVTLVNCIALSNGTVLATETFMKDAGSRGYFGYIDVFWPFLAITNAGGWTAGPGITTLNPMLNSASCTISSISSPAVDSGLVIPSISDVYTSLGPDMGWKESSYVINHGPYYVDDTSGDDANPGTFGLPFRTIQRAANEMTNTAPVCTSATTYVFPGTYQEKVRVWTNRSSGYMLFTRLSNTRPKLFGGGMTNNGFVLSDDRVVIDGFYITGFVSSGIQFVTNRAQRCIIRSNVISAMMTNGLAGKIFRCEIIGNTFCSNMVRDIHMISARSNLVSGNRFSGFTSTAIHLKDPVGNVLWGNRFGPQSKGVYFQKVTTLALAPGNWLVKNEFATNIEYAIAVADTSAMGGYSGLVIRSNVIHHSGKAMDLADMSSIVVGRNLIYSNYTTPPIEVAGMGHSIVNNTFQGTNQFEIRINGAVCDIFNNVILARSWGLVQSGGAVRFAYNVVFSGVSPTNVASGTLTWGAGNTSANPLLTVDGQYLPVSGFSPVVDTGTNLWGAGFQGNAWDMGWKESPYTASRLSPPVLIAPADRLWMNDNTPLLDWTPVAGAGTYVVRLNAHPTNTGLNTDYTPSPLAQGMYDWNVVALSPEGVKGTNSLVQRFMIDTNAPSAPVLVSPPDMSVVPDNTPDLVWQAVRDGDASPVICYDGETVPANQAYSWGGAAIWDVNSGTTAPHSGSMSMDVDLLPGSGVGQLFDSTWNGYNASFATNFVFWAKGNTGVGSRIYIILRDKASNPSSYLYFDVPPAGVWQKFVFSRWQVLSNADPAFDLSHMTVFDINSDVLCSLFLDDVAFNCAENQSPVARYEVGIAGVSTNISMSTQYSWPVGLGSGAYTWAVRAVDTASNKGIWSVPRIFDIATYWGPFYVDDNSGDDTNSGSISAPFRTIQKAAFRMQAGPPSCTSATTFVFPGTYKECLRVSANNNTGRMVFKPLTNSRMPLLSGAGLSNTALLITNAPSVSFLSFRIAGFATNVVRIAGNSPDAEIRGCSISSNPATLVVVNSEAADRAVIACNTFRFMSDRDLMRVSGADNMQVWSNYVSRIGPNGYGFQFGDNCMSNVVARNTFISNNNWMSVSCSGVQVYANQIRSNTFACIASPINLTADSKYNQVAYNDFSIGSQLVGFGAGASSNRITRNTFRDSFGTGVSAIWESSRANTIVSNVFRRVGTGISIANAAGYLVGRNLFVSNTYNAVFQKGTATNFIIANNTFYRCGNDAVVISNVSSATLRNNIFFSNGDALGECGVKRGSVGIVRVEFNCFYGNYSGPTNGSVSWGTGNISGAPLLAGGPDYLISSALSSAVNSGTTNTPVSRPYLSTAPDLGWKESPFAAVVSVPLRLMSSNPVDGQASVLTTSTILLSFSTNVDPASVDATSIKLMDSGYIPIACSRSVTGSNVSLTPSSGLPANEYVIVRIETNVQSVAGVNLVQVTQFHFITVPGNPTYHYYRTNRLDSLLSGFDPANIMGTNTAGGYVYELLASDGPDTATVGATRQLLATWNTNYLYLAIGKTNNSTAVDWYDYILIDTTRDDRGATNLPANAGYLNVRFDPNRRPESVIVLCHTHLITPGWVWATNFQWNGSIWTKSAWPAADRSMLLTGSPELRLSWATYFGGNIPNRISIAAFVSTNSAANDWCPEAAGPNGLGWVTIDPDNNGDQIPDGLPARTVQILPPMDLWFASITNAVKAVTNNCVIEVHPLTGGYIERVLVQNLTNVTIRSYDWMTTSDNRSTIVNGTAGSYCFRVSAASNVSIIGFTLKNAGFGGNGIVQYQSGASGEVAYNVIYSNMNAGVQVLNGSSPLVRRNIISNVSFGVDINGGFPAAVIQSNRIMANNTGIQFMNVSSGLPFALVASGNTIKSAMTGLFVNMSMNLSGISNNTVRGGTAGLLVNSSRAIVLRGNTFAANQEGASIQWGSTNILLQRNIFISNSIHGIEVEGAKGVTLTANQVSWSLTNAIKLNSSFAASVSSNTLTHSADGIFVVMTSNSRLFRNTLLSNQFGIRFGSQISRSNYVISNRIAAIRCDGIRVEYAQNNAILANDVSGCSNGIGFVNNGIGNNIVSFNILTKNTNGLSYSSTGNNVVRLNTMTSNVIGFSSWWFGGMSVNLNRNNLAGNRLAAISNVSGTLGGSLTNNWYGTTRISNVRKLVKGGVTQPLMPYRLFGPFDTAFGMDTDPLPVITKLTSWATNGTQVRLVWTRPSDVTDFVRYSVYRFTNAGYTNFDRSCVVAQTFPAWQTNILDTPPSNRKWFYFVTVLDDPAPQSGVLGLTNESWYSTGSFALLGSTWNGPFYVDDDSGSDANAGTFTSPFLTIQRAVGRMSSGINVTSATCFVFPGTYAGRVEILSNSNPGYMVITRLSNSMPHLDGGFVSTNAIALNGVSDVVVRGFMITGYTNSGIAIFGASTNNHISLSQIAGAFSGILVVDGVGNSFQSNVVFNNKDNGVYMVGASSQNRFARNTFYSNKTYGIRLNSDNADNNTIISNRILAGNGTGLGINHGDNNRIIRNLFVRALTYGVNLSGTATNILLVNNTIFGTVDNDAIYLKDSAQCYVINNIIYSNGSGAIDYGIDNTGTGTVFISFNDFNRNNGSSYNGIVVWGNGNVTNAPLIDTVTSFTIKSALSPAVDSASNFWGGGWTGSGWDMGWKESSFVVITAPVLQLKKSVDKPLSKPFDILTYTISYSNSSAGTVAPGAQIIDVLPSWVGILTNGAETANAPHAGGVAVWYDTNASGSGWQNSAFDTPATAAAIRRVRWVLDTQVLPGEKGIVRFKVIVK